MPEDITQDPEYIRGYEQGVEQYRRNHSPHHYGFVAGLHALETPEVVESKATPGSSKDEFSQFKEKCSADFADVVRTLGDIVEIQKTHDERLSKIEEKQRKLDERLGRLEEYTKQ